MYVCAWQRSACLLDACNDAIVSQWSAVYVFPRMPSGRSVRVRKARPCSQYNHKLFSGDMLSFIQVQPCAPKQPLAGFLMHYCSAPFCSVTPQFRFCERRFPVINCLSEFCLAEMYCVSLQCSALLCLEFSALLVCYTCIKKKGGGG